MRTGDVVLYMTDNLLSLHAFVMGVWRANGIVRPSYTEDEPSKPVIVFVYVSDREFKYD